MRTPSQPGCPTPDMCDDLIARGIWVREASPLETAMALFENTGGELTFIPVIRGEPGQDETVCGALFHVDALAAYNRALADTAAEEHS
jgi:CIC family chloride channel protein